MRTLLVRARHDQRQRDCALIGLPAGAQLRQLRDRQRGALLAPEHGVLISRQLGIALGIGIGERLLLELREGERRTVHAPVVGYVDDVAGLQVYARADMLAKFEQAERASSSALLRIDPRRARAVERALRASPAVIDVSDARDDIERLRATNGAAMDVWATVSITLSVLVIFGVIYNDARIALETQSRDLGSLRVLGFSRGEISSVLLGELVVEMLVAIPLGLWLGTLWGRWFMQTVDPETMRWTVQITSRTYVLATGIACLAAASSALWVRRRLDRLDLIGVLKMRE